MTVQRNGCKCEKPILKKTLVSNRFITVICDNCLEVISYEKIKLPKKKKSKNVLVKDETLKIVDMGGKNPQVEMNIE